MHPSLRRRTLIATALIAPLALGACASLMAARGEVSSFGQWPSGRQPGSYAFERLPSQQQDAEQQAVLERQADAALQARGFKPVAADQKADVVVQVGARVTRQSRSPWDDPLWWRFGGVGMGPGWRGPWLGYAGWRWNAPMDPEYDREVALLLRDGASGTPLYEARARNSGATPGAERLIGDLFRLSMADFPQARPEPHEVSLPAQ